MEIALGGAKGEEEDPHHEHHALPRKTSGCCLAAFSLIVLEGARAPQPWDAEGCWQGEHHTLEPLMLGTYSFFRNTIALVCLCN